MNQQEDECLWKRENGEFKYGFITSQTWDIISVHAPKVMWYKSVWFREATPKFSFITWVATHNRLATGVRVIRWNPQAISAYWLCHGTNESRDHLFFECQYSSEVWRSTIGNLAGDRRLDEWSQVVNVLVNGLHDKMLTFLVRYCFQAVIYAIWYERNVRRVGELAQPAGCLIGRLDKLVRNRITSLRKKPGGRYEKAMEVWFGRK